MNEKFLGKPMPGYESGVIRSNQVTPTFTVGVLLYGSNFALAQRCLESIASLPGPERVELRIGLNEACPATKDLAQHIFTTQNDNGRNVLLYDSTYNRGKYPVMRWMFHDPTNPVKAPFIQWFDDDSYIKTPTSEWLDDVERVMADADMCGAVMHTQLTGNQPLWITMQPWYKGIPLAQMIPTGRAIGKSTAAYQPKTYYVPKFAVGGWWTMKTSVLKRLDWPPQNIVHRGGDYMLGEALAQNNFKLVDYTNGVAINADEAGNNHKAARRGMNPLPVGIDYEPPLSILLHDATKEIEPKLLDYPGI
jgi:GT2 family glycosyltransferase